MTMPIVTTIKANITVPNDPNDPVVYGIIPIDQLLSKHYAKNIRQGHSFKVKGVQTSIRPSDGLTDDWDTGASCITTFEYLSPTKYPRKAWNAFFQQWKKQRSLAMSHSQGQKRYDDFEIGWNTTSAYSIGAGRVSTIRSGGLTDSTSEGVYIWGNSTEGADATLQDFCNSQYDLQPTPLDPFGNVTYKNAKFDTNNVFPTQYQSFQSHSVASNNVAVLSGTNGFMGSDVAGNMEELPLPADVMCGLLAYRVHVPINDTLSQYADTFDLIINLWVDSWKPLVYRPRRKMKRVKKTYRGRTSGKGTRYSRRRNRR